MMPNIPNSPTVDAISAEQRAKAFTTRSIKASAKAQGLRLALSMIDLTTLEGQDSDGKVRKLCQKAVSPGPGLPSVAAVCFYPTKVRLAKQLLEGTGVNVASVATGFPSGQYPLDVRLRDCEQAIEDGADEIDMVISRGAMLAGDHAAVYQEILSVSELCHQAGRHLKVILETGELESLDHVRRASDIAIAAMSASGLLEEPGAGFIKTSTGKVSPAATMPVTLIMLEAIRDAFDRDGLTVGMKPAGGIRAAKQALHYLVMVNETLGQDWLSPHLFRFGASSLANDIIRQLLKQETGTYSAAYDVSEA